MATPSGRHGAFTHTAIWSSGAPPTKRSVSRLSPSVPVGLSPLTWGSPSTASMPLRRLRFTTSWCHLPGSTRTLLVMTPVPEPVLNLEQKMGRLTAVPPRREVACTVKAAAPQAEAGNLNLCLFGKVKIIPPWVSGAFLSLYSPLRFFLQCKNSAKKRAQKKKKSTSHTF